MADTGYTPFPSVQPTADALPEQSIAADEETFGAGIGRGLQRTGGVLRQAQEAQFALSLQFAKQQMETQALDASSAYIRETNQIVTGYRQLNGQQAVDAYPEIEKQLIARDKEIGKTLKSPLAQNIYKSRSQSVLNSALEVAGGHAANQGSAAHTAAKIGAIGAAQSKFALNFGLAPTAPDISEIVGLSVDLAEDQGMLPQARDMLIQKNVSEAFGQVFGIRLYTGDIAGAEAVLTAGVTAKVPGTDLPVFSGDLFAVMNQRLENAKASQASQAQAAILAQERQAKLDYGKAVASATSTLVQKDGSIHITPQYFQQLQQAGAMPGALLDPEGQRAAINFGISIQKEQESGENIISDPSVYEDFGQRMSRPASDPTRLTAMQVYQARFNKQLSKEDTAFFLGATEKLSADPAKREMEQRYQDFLSGMKPSIAKSDFFGNILNSDQSQKWYQFQFDTRRLIEKAYADGTWQALLDVRSQQYMGNLVAPYVLDLKGAQGAIRSKLQGGASVVPPPPVPTLPGALIRRPAPSPSGANITIPIAPRVPTETPEQYLQRTGR